MHACDVLAYTYDGTVYCPDCIGDDKNGEETGVIFGSDLDANIGATCGACRKCMDEHGHWLTAEDICNPRFYRWATCESCNHRQPFEVRGLSARDRLEAMRGRLGCPDCAHGSMHF